MDPELTLEKAKTGIHQKEAVDKQQNFLNDKPEGAILSHLENIRCNITVTVYQQYNNSDEYRIQHYSIYTTA